MVHGTQIFKIRVSLILLCIFLTLKIENGFNFSALENLYFVNNIYIMIIFDLGLQVFNLLCTNN